MKVFVLCWTLLHAQHIVLPPPAPAAQEMTVVYFPGANVHPEAYEPLMVDIQQAMEEASIALTVLILAYPNVAGIQVPPFLQTEKFLQTALQLLPTKPSTIVLAGHSLGGILAQKVMFASSRYQALWLHASFVQESHYDKVRARPVLSISGTRDGLNRLTHVALQYEALTRVHTLVIAGMNHIGFCNAESNTYLDENDLVPTISLTEAVQEIVDMTMAFTLEESLEDYERQAELILQPFIQALDADVEGQTCAQLQVLHGIEDNVRVAPGKYHARMQQFLRSSPKRHDEKWTVQSYGEKQWDPIGTSFTPAAVQKLLCQINSVQEDSCARLNTALHDEMMERLPQDILEAYAISGKILRFDDRPVSTLRAMSGLDIGEQEGIYQVPQWTNSDVMACSLISQSQIYEHVLIDAHRK